MKYGFYNPFCSFAESPLLVSFPHFLYADKSYLEDSQGLKPDAEKHKTEFLIEPVCAKNTMKIQVT